MTMRQNESLTSNCKQHRWKDGFSHNAWPWNQKTDERGDYYKPYSLFPKPCNFYHSLASTFCSGDLIVSIYLTKVQKVSIFVL